MDTKKILATSAIAAAFAIAAPTAVNAGGGMGKCFGVAEKGKNGCEGNGHDCGGKATGNYHPNDWMELSKVDCRKKVKELKTAGKKDPDGKPIKFKWEPKKKK